MAEKISIRFFNDTENLQLVSATTQLELTGKINDREMFMKGIDYS